jgi:hypothetical protein
MLILDAQPATYKCHFSIFSGVTCGNEPEDKRELETRLLKVCGQDSKGNRVCAEKREVELDARFLEVCGQDSKGNRVCAEKREELDARSITVSSPFVCLECIILTLSSAGYRLWCRQQGEQSLRQLSEARGIRCSCYQRMCFLCFCPFYPAERRHSRLLSAVRMLRATRSVLTPLPMAVLST